MGLKSTKITLVALHMFDQTNTSKFRFDRSDLHMRISCKKSNDRHRHGNIAHNDSIGVVATMFDLQPKYSMP